MSYNVVILGSTGSIGKRAIDVLQNLNYRIIGIAGGINFQLIAQQAINNNCLYASMNDEQNFKSFSQALPKTCQALLGEQGMIQMIQDKRVDFILCSIVGIAGLRPILEAIRLGKIIAFANKEILVMAGELIIAEAKKYKATLIPVDSEHSALFQCLQGHNKKDINRLILSCSGGPFRNYSYQELNQVTIQQALNHPTWKMGKKITIDSATLMNKALEIIEAYWLFEIPIDKIDVVIHPQSIIHSLVEYIDGSTIAQLGVTDMAIPIQYALTYPRHHQGLKKTKLDWTKSYNLEFFPPNNKIFPSLEMARQVIKQAGTLPTAFNAANEIAVEAFLQNKISFLQICYIIKKVINQHKNTKIINLDTIILADKETRIKTKQIINANQ